MTVQEFTGPFQLLCRGLECQPTSEQLGAWFRRIGHIHVEVWKWTVDSLLFDGRRGYLPKLEHVLEVVERERENHRRALVEQDKQRAKKTYTLLSQPVNPDEQSRMPTPGTPLFACIRAFAGREDVLRRLAALKLDQHKSEAEKTRERERLGIFLAQYEKDIETYSPLIHDDDAARLVRKYETPGAA